MPQAIVPFLIVAAAQAVLQVASSFLAPKPGGGGGGAASFEAPPQTLGVSMQRRPDIPARIICGMPRLSSPPIAIEFENVDPKERILWVILPMGQGPDVGPVMFHADDDTIAVEDLDEFGRF